LLDRINLDFLFSAAVFTNASSLDISEPFHTVAIRVGTNSFKNDQVTFAVFTSWRHSSLSPSKYFISQPNASIYILREHRIYLLQHHCNVWYFSKEVKSKLVDVRVVV
jgi:hypothetical protein